MVRSGAEPVQVCQPDLQLDGVWEEIAVVGGDCVMDLNRNQSQPSKVRSQAVPV